MRNEAETRQEEGKPGRKVLLVDDDPVLRRLCQMQLKEAGFEVILASTGEEALENTRRLLPEVVLIDILLPGMDGWQVCRALKSDPKTATIPVFLLTGLGKEEHIQRHRQCEANGYFIKPFRMEVLAATLREITEKKHRAKTAA